MRCGDIRVLELVLFGGLFRPQYHLAAPEGEGDPDLGLSPLHSAVALNNLRALDALLRAGHDSAFFPRRRVGGSENALHCAVRRRAADATALILRHAGRHGSGRPFTRDTRLHLAALDDDEPAVTRLLDLGMRADAKSKARTHTLRFANVKRKILEAYTCRRTHAQNGYTAAHLAAFFGSAAALRALIRHPDNATTLSVRDDDGLLPINAASKSVWAMREILGHPSSPCLLKQQDLLAAAVRDGSHEVAELLLLETSTEVSAATAHWTLTFTNTELGGPDLRMLALLLRHRPFPDGPPPGCPRSFLMDLLCRGETAAAAMLVDAGARLDRGPRWRIILSELRANVARDHRREIKNLFPTLLHRRGSTPLQPH